MYQEAIMQQPVIEAGRFILRPLRKSDAGLISMYTADRRVAEGTRAIPHPCRGATEAFITRAMAEKRAGCLGDGWLGQRAGRSGHRLADADRAGSIRSGILGRPGSSWNTGFASEAVQALVEANPHQSRTLFAEVFGTNPGSARVLGNAGFEYLGDAECWSVARNAGADLDLSAQDGVIFWAGRVVGEGQPPHAHPPGLALPDHPAPKPDA